MNTFKNGTFTEFYMKAENTQLNGPVTAWHANGQIHQEATYRNGKAEGIATDWYENGQLKM